MKFMTRLLTAAFALAGLALTSPAVSYNNTLIYQRADPHIYKHTYGYYYFTATVPAYDRIILRRAQSIQALAAAPESTIWTRKPSGPGSGQVWAPEIHHIDGKWYIYVALGVAGEWRVRPFVLEGTGANALTATWVERGRVDTGQDTFSLDMSTFEVNGTRYLIWAQDDRTWNETNTSIMIARMGETPWSITGTPAAISRPDQPWERIPLNINEGPFAIVKNGRVFVTYSASATDANYSMGLLSASLESNLVNSRSWTKSVNPVFVSNNLTNQWGPGHNSFTVSEDGLSDVLVFHDRGYRDISGDPLGDPNRRTRVQKLYWKADGIPDFGVPVADGKTPVRLSLKTDRGLFVRHRGTTGQQAQVAVGGWASIAETQFKIVTPGLAGSSTVSLESVSNPGSFLRRSRGQVVVALRETGQGFNNEASFIQRQGLADNAGVSFEAVGAEGSFVGSDAGNNLVVTLVQGEAGRGRATFFTE